MKEIQLEYNDYYIPYVTGSSEVLHIGDEVKFTIGKGEPFYVRVVSKDDAMRLNNGIGCSRCPFDALGGECPSGNEYGGISLCPFGGFMVSVGSYMEEL